MRRIFLEDLKKRIINGKECIDWKGSVGSEIRFEYNGVTGTVNITQYKNGYLWVSYDNGNPYKIKCGHFKDGAIGSIINEYQKGFKVKIGDILKDKKRDLTVVDLIYKKTNKYCKYKCNVCGWNNGEMTEAHLLNGVGCSCCSGRTVVKGINDIATTNPEMIKHFKYKNDAYNFNKYSEKEAVFKCIYCGREKKSKICNIYSRNKVACICGDGISYPQKFLTSMLIQLGVKFKTEETFEWSNNKRYDFYIPSVNCIIEAHGSQHYTNEFKVEKRRTLKEEKENDEIKYRLAVNNGISNYIVIDSRQSRVDFIKNSIYDSEISNIFDLSNIDWQKCGVYAVGNLVKDVCDYKNENVDVSNNKIDEMFNISRTTVTEYLNQGMELGWCNNYVEKHKSIIEKSDNTPKQVVVLKCGEILGRFDSLNQLEKESEVRFNTFFHRSAMRKVCQGKLKHYKGYTFKYID